MLSVNTHAYCCCQVEPKLYINKMSEAKNKEMLTKCCLEKVVDFMAEWEARAALQQVCPVHCCSACCTTDLCW